ncbi:MAG: ABC transporter ATP-binding protein [Bdellovibrionota bacterium]|nr:ABC transporter ATP-binding protein [Bdellovibrionota bacterium]
MALVEISGVKKSFGKVNVLGGINLSLLEDREYVIQGASGSGKSTLLYLLGGLDKPSSGKIKINNMDLADFQDEELARYRNTFVGFVFQFHFLLSSLNCLDNALLPSKLGDFDEGSIKKRILELADFLGVDHCLQKNPFELSGGEQQRINIIRALSLKPKLLLCDEPTGSLDSENSEKVIGLLKKLSKEFGATLVLVTHNGEIASTFESIINIQDGLIRKN